MKFSLDFLDNDVSKLIGDCVNYKKNYNIVLNELNLFNRNVNIIKDEITTTSKKQKITLKDTKSYIKN